MNKSYHEILKKYTEKLLPLNHVVGVGYGKKIKDNDMTDEECIIVMVDQKLPEAELEKEDIIPQQLDGMKTDVQEVGEIRLLQIPRDKKFRPAPGGVSIGHYSITAGTLGAIVKDKETGEPLILSNNHILANTSNGRDGKAKIGDPILQPAAYDNGSKERDTIAHLYRFVPLEPTRSIFRPIHNTVDCAVAKPVSKEVVENSILEIGQIKGIAEAEIGVTVVKSGRTTGLTESRIRAIDSTVRVRLDPLREAIFTDQIVADAFSEGGDSGSLVLDKENRVVGLLFAGSNRATICNKISNVLEQLNIEFYEPCDEEEQEKKEEEKEQEKREDKEIKEKEPERILDIPKLYSIYLVLLILILDLAYRKL